MKKIENNIMRSFFLWGIALLLATLALTSSINPAEAAKKKKETETKPIYATSGSIPGTQLAYENLLVNSHGVVTVTIHNPASTGVSFSANFTFYDGKGQSVASFSLSGFANARTRNAHMLQLNEYKNFKKTTNLKVLGRSGRNVE